MSVAVSSPVLFKSRIDAAGGLHLLLLSEEQLISAATCARVCVWIFVLLSAYGLSVQYKRRVRQNTDIGSFVKHYWISTMKPYWFCYVICLILSLFLFKRPWVVYQNKIINFVLDVFAWSDFFGTPQLSNVWWYMCLAQCVILLIPFLNEAVKRFGWIVIPASFLAIQFLEMSGIQSKFGGAYIHYLFIAVAGVWFAQYDVFEKIAAKQSRKVILNIIDFILLLALVCISVFIQLKYSPDDKWKYTKLFMSAGALLIAVISFKFFTWKWLKAVLRFLGKYSGTIFLIHGFGYTYYLKQVYWSHNVFLTWLTLMLASLAAAILIDKLRWLIGKIPFMKKLV